MPKPSGLVNEREQAICARVRKVRERIKWPRHAFASRLGITVDQLSAIERGLTPLRFGAAETMCFSFNVSMEWLAGLEEKDRRFLALGLTVEARAKWTDNALFSKAFDALKPISSTHWGGPEFTDEFRKVILEVAYRATPPTLPFSALKDIGDWAGKTGDDVRFEKPEDEFDFYGKGFALISDLLEEAIETGKASRAPRPANNKYDFHIADAVEENSACIITPKSNNKSVPPKPLNLDLLLIRVNQVASLRGKKSELADHLGVSRSRVSEWLNRAKEPGGKVTLRLLEWVQAEEASQQQNEKAGHASTRPAHKTRARKSKHEKSKASPK